MIFISYGSAFAESTGLLFSAGLGMPPQFDVQRMVGASKLQGAWAEVWGASVKVWCGVEGWVE